MDDFAYRKPYDILYPSPIPLKDLSAIAVAIQLWRLDVNEFIKSDDFEKDVYCEYFQLAPKFTLLDVIPYLPSVIYQITLKYQKRLKYSTMDWILTNYSRIFRFHCVKPNAILKDFYDIVCDHDGTIHYVRTAKRLMLCDRISPDVKFKIACEYCFEEDIRQLWPYVRSKVDLDEIEFDKFPNLHYWVRCLRNEIDEIPNVENIPIFELMLNKSRCGIRSSYEYFWNLAGLENRSQSAVKVMLSVEDFDGATFCGRFILPKLNDEQLNTFVTNNGIDLMFNLCKNPEGSELVFAVWIRIKDKMNEINFARLILNLLLDEPSSIVENPSIKRSKYEYARSCCMIWNGAANDLKLLVMYNLFPAKFPAEDSFKKPLLQDHRPTERLFLLRVLLNASLKGRRIFWSNHWIDLLYSTRIKDFSRIMKLCFANNEYEISQFKKNTMAKYETLDQMSKVFIYMGLFKYLADTFDFICSDDVQTRRDLKRQCLHSSFLDEFSLLNENVIRESESMHEFINDAFAHDADLINDFYNQLLSSPYTETALLTFIYEHAQNFFRVEKFVDSFELRGYNADHLKKRFVDELKSYLINGRIIRLEYLQHFLVWCLGSKEEAIEAFRQLTPPSDDALRNYMRQCERYSFESGKNKSLDEQQFLTYPLMLDTVLACYLNNPEEFRKRLRRTGRSSIIFMISLKTFAYLILYFSLHFLLRSYALHTIPLCFLASLLSIVIASVLPIHYFFT